MYVAACVKDIYRTVQLKHHETNWEELPKSLAQRLKIFAGEINPPMVKTSCGRRWKSSQTPMWTQYARLPAKWIGFKFMRQHVWQQPKRLCYNERTSQLYVIHHGSIDGMLQRDLTAISVFNMRWSRPIQSCCSFRYWKRLFTRVLRVSEIRIAVTWCFKLITLTNKPKTMHKHTRRLTRKTKLQKRTKAKKTS